MSTVITDLPHATDENVVAGADADGQIYKPADSVSFRG